MLLHFVAQFDKSREALRESFASYRPGNYAEIVCRVISFLADAEDEEYNAPDPKRITCIDHGHYQGTQLFVIGAQGYQPCVYWHVSVSYGSCSSCDSFLRAVEATDYDALELSSSTLDQLMLMSLHIVQGLRLMSK